MNVFGMVVVVVMMVLLLLASIFLRALAINMTI
jgi:hypothetical protein